MAKADKAKSTGKGTSKSELVSSAAKRLDIPVAVSREAVLYARVTDANKKWIETEAFKRGVSVSVLVNKMIDAFRG